MQYCKLCCQTIGATEIECCFRHLRKARKVRGGETPGKELFGEGSGVRIPFERDNIHV